MDIETIEEVQYEQAYDEVNEHRILKGLKIESGELTKILESRAKGAFRHTDGYLLTVDADIFFNEPNITVETASQDVDEYGYNQWNFDSVTALEAWLASNATLLR